MATQPAHRRKTGATQDSPRAHDTPTLSLWRSFASPLAGGAAGAFGGPAGRGGCACGCAGVWLLLEARSTSIRQVGQVCCLWNQERKQLWGGQGKDSISSGFIRENSQV